MPKIGRKKCPSLLQLALFIIFVLLLPRLAFSDSTDELIRETESEVYNVYSSAISKLGKNHDRQAVDALIKILERDQNESKRILATAALGEFDGPFDRSAIKTLIKTLSEDTSSGVRTEAARTIGRYYSFGEYRDQDPLAALGEALGDANELVRSAAAGGLNDAASHGVRDPNLVPALIKALSDKSDSVRWEAPLVLGKYKDTRAVEALIRALKDQENLVRSRSAEALGQLGDKRAVDALFPMLKDKDSDVRNEATNALKKLGLSDEAIKGGGHDPRNKLALIGRELQNGNYYTTTIISTTDLRKEAIALVARLDSPPTEPETALQYMAQGLAAFKMAGSPTDLEDAVKYFTLASNHAPWWANPYFNLGLVYEKQRNYYDAIRALELYLLAAPNAADVTAVKQKIYEIRYIEERAKKADVHLDRGVEYHNSGRYRDAVYEYKEALRFDPENGEAQHLLGASYLKLKQNKDAIVALKEAIRLGHGKLNTYWRLAEAYEDLGSLDKAIDTYEEVLRVGKDDFFFMSDSDRASMHKNLGIDYKMRGNFDKAIENYQKAIEYGHRDSVEIKGWINNLKRRLGS